MPINLTCTCGRKLQIRDEYGGREGKCPACGRTLQIPLAEDTSAPVPSARVVHIPDQDQGDSHRPDEDSGEPVRDHGDGDLPHDADFFVHPPEEIGPVASAYTTLRKGVQPLAPGIRILACLAAGLAGLAVGGIIDAIFEPNEFFTIVWPGAGFLLGVGLTYYFTGFSHTCTYVGREGVARYVCSGSRDNLTTAEVFRFRDATDLRTSQTIHYYNGAYTHTSYTFSWSDVGGRTRYMISGQHKTREGNPPSGDFYHFGRAAELAWTIYLLHQAYRQIDLSGSVLFNLANGQWVRLGAGLVIFGMGREPIECSADELAGCQVQQGVVCIRRHDAQEGWFSSSGVYKFNFSDLANAQLFFHMLDKVVGIPVG